MYLKCLSFILLLMFSITLLSSCKLKSMLNTDSKWVSEYPDIYFEVSEDGQLCSGKAKIDDNVIISFRIDAQTDIIWFSSVNRKMQEDCIYLLKGVYRCDGKKLKDNSAMLFHIILK